jgi:serine/threonine-protein kinase
MDTDRNLLFGVLALQADLLDPPRFAEACTAWSARKDRPLAEILLERGWLTAEDLADVEKLLARKLKKHGGDVRATLSEATPDHVRRTIASITDAGVRDSLTDTTPPAGGLRTTADHPTASRERYTLSRLHAKGGIGRVWLARDESLGRDVALKELLPERAVRPSLRARFLMEARITGQLEHPGIVPIYELGRRPEDGQPFYTMRFVRGRTLALAVEDYHRRRVARGSGPMELRELLTAFVGVCNAVGYAHSRGVLHRDLKPQNVVLGDYGEVVVLDWGLARLIDAPAEGGDDTVPERVDAGSDVAATVQGQALGTPAYMAPEQAEGRLALFGPRTDVYGLGAILFEILTGRPPFLGDNTTAVLRQVVHSLPPAPRSLVPQVASALEAICLRALAKKPDRRYESTRAMAGDIERWMADEPVSAWREPLRVRAGRWVRKHRTAVTAALAALSVAVVGLLAVAAVQSESRHRLADSNRELAGANARLASARDRAEGRVDLALGAVASFRSAVDGNLDVKNRPENAALRKTLLQAPLAFYQKLRDELKADADAGPAGQSKLADAYLELGKLDNDIGSQAEALKAFDEAVSLLEPLSRDEALSTRDEHRLRLDRALNDRGEVQHVSASLIPAALESFGQARDLLRARIREDPGDVAAWLELARTLGGVAAVAERKGEVDPSLATLRERLGVLGEAGRLEPTRVGVALQEVDTHLRMSDILRIQRSRLPEALASTEAALRIVEPLAAAHPGDPECQLELAKVYGARASLHAERGEADKALAYYQKRLAVVESLAAARPAVTNYQYQRVLALNSVGDTQTELDRNEPALATLGRARDLAAALVRDNPANVKFRRARARSWNLLSGPQYALGKIADAVASIEKNASELQEIGRADPGDLSTRRDIAGAHYNIGLLNEAIGRHGKALAAYDKALRLREQLAREHPDDPRFDFDVAATLGNVATILKQRWQYEQARAPLGRAAEILKKLATAHPENAEYQSYFLRAQANAGSNLSYSSRPDEALQLLRPATEGFQRVVRDHPGVVQYQLDLLESLDFLGEAYRRAGRVEEARAAFKKGIEAGETALKANADSPMHRERLALLCKEQGVLFQQGGQPADAAASYRRAVAYLEGITSPASGQLAALSECRARLAGLAAVTSARLPPGSARAEADKAMDALHRAVAEGYRGVESLRRREDFDPLRKRDDFQKLLREMEAKEKEED